MFIDAFNPAEAKRFSKASQLAENRIGKSMRCLH